MTVQEQIERLRTQRAAEWLQTLREDEPASHAQFVQWITESPLNLEEFLKLDALSRETQALLRSADFDRNALPGRTAPQVLRFDVAAGIADSPVAKRRFARGRIVGIAASVAAVALTALWVYSQLWAWKDYSTGQGQQKTVELADGSLVYLNAESKLRVRLDGSERALRLTQGEALFNVASDKQRPFRVITRDTVVEAVGTQFNVNARGAATRVAVIEGKVKITRGDKERGPDAPAETALQAGEAAQVSALGIVERDRAADVQADAAWSQPELVFEGTPLEDAVEQFNRHRRSKHLRLEGLAAGSHHYTGIFNATDAESFAALLAREKDLEILVADDEIVIRKR